MHGKRMRIKKAGFPASGISPPIFFYYNSVSTNLHTMKVFFFSILFFPQSQNHEATARKIQMRCIECRQKEKQRFYSLLFHERIITKARSLA